MLASTSFREESVESIITSSDGLVRWHLTIRLDTVFQTEEFPAPPTWGLSPTDATSQAPQAPQTPDYTPQYPETPSAPDTIEILEPTEAPETIEILEEPESYEAPDTSEEDDSDSSSETEEDCSNAVWFQPWTWSNRCTTKTTGEVDSSFTTD